MPEMVSHKWFDLVIMAFGGDEDNLSDKARQALVNAYAWKELDRRLSEMAEADGEEAIYKLVKQVCDTMFAQGDHKLLDKPVQDRLFEISIEADKLAGLDWDDWDEQGHLKEVNK